MRSNRLCVALALTARSRLCVSQEREGERPPPPPPKLTSTRKRKKKKNNNIEKRVKIHFVHTKVYCLFLPLGPYQGLLSLSTTRSIPRSIVSFYHLVHTRSIVSFFHPVFLRLSCVIIRLTDRPADRQTYT